MDIIFAIDAQGFIVNQRFYPRELAIKGPSCQAYFEFDLSGLFLSERDRKSANYCYKYIHGIPYSCSNFTPSIPVCLFENIIMHYYNKFKTEKRCYLACKNSQLRSILERLKIPVKNLDQIQLPPINYPNCNIHKDIWFPKCAKAKVLQIANYFKNERNRIWQNTNTK